MYTVIVITKTSGVSSVTPYDYKDYDSALEKFHYELYYAMNLKVVDTIKVVITKDGINDIRAEHWEKPLVVSDEILLSSENE